MRRRHPLLLREEGQAGRQTQARVGCRQGCRRRERVEQEASGASQNSNAGSLTGGFFSPLGQSHVAAQKHRLEAYRVSKMRADPWLPRLGADGVFHVSTLPSLLSEERSLHCTAGTAAAPVAERLPPSGGPGKPWGARGCPARRSGEKPVATAGTARTARPGETPPRTRLIEDSRLPGIRQQFMQNQQTFVLQFMRACN